MHEVSELEALQEGENAALALRHRLGLGLDVAELDEIARELDVLIVRHPFGDDAPDGMYTYDGQQGIVTVNASKPPQRTRFTLAHELGHHELHRFRGAQQLVDVDIYSTAGSDGGKDLDEVAANSFAAHLLLPAGGIAATLGTARNAKVGPDQVVALVRRYRVSWEMVCNRLRNEGCVRKVDRERLLSPAVNRTATLAANGIGPDHYGGGPALPAELVQGAARLWQAWVITDERLAQIMEASVDEALATMQQWGLERVDRAGHAAEEGAAALRQAGVSAEDILAALELEDDENDDG